MSTQAIEQITHVLRDLRIQLVGRRIIYSIIIGLIAGLGGIIFFTMSHVAIHYCLGFLIGYTPPSPSGETLRLPEFVGRPLHRWLFFLIPTIGGLLSGWVVYRFAPEAEGHGTDAVIESFHHHGGRIRGRVPIVKTIASVFTLGTGGSGGREGPIAQIGAGFGSFLADRLKLSDGERRIMAISGLAGGIGAIFKSPLAGAIFAVEVLYREEDIESDALIPATVASITGYSLFASVFGWTPLFKSPNFTFSHAIELLPYTTLGLLCAVVGLIYVKTFQGVHDLAHHLQIPNTIKPAIGGLLTGTIGYFWPQAIGLGYGYVQNALDNQIGPLFLLTIVVGKILATSFSIGSGGSAGVFGPSIVIGGALGGVVGGFWHQWFPNMVASPGAFVLVGMAGFFAGVASTPISTVIMVSELTGNYNLLAPLMWVCTISFILLRRWSIYEKQVPNRLASPAHQNEFIVGALDVLRVGDWMTKDVVSIPEQMRVQQISEYVRKAMHAHYTVLNSKAELVGVVSLRDILEAFHETPKRQQETAGELAKLDAVTITREQTLSEALSIINSQHSDFLPVVESPDSKRLVGVLSRQDLITAYNYITEQAKGEKTAPRLNLSDMEQIFVRNMIRTEYDAISELTPLSQIIELEESSPTIDYPVIDAEGHFVGMLQFQAFRSVLSQDVVYPLVIARDLLTTDVEPLMPTDTLADALAKFGRHDFDCLPVMDLNDPRKPIGIVRRSDLMERYRQTNPAPG